MSLIEGHPLGLFCVVCGSEYTTLHRSSEIDEDNVMRLVDVLANPDDFAQLDFQACLLQNLPNPSVTEALAELHLASGNSPESLSGIVATLYQKNAAVFDQHHPDADQWAIRGRHHGA